MNEFVEVVRENWKEIIVGGIVVLALFWNDLKYMINYVDMKKERHIREGKDQKALAHLRKRAGHLGDQALIDAIEVIDESFYRLHVGVDKKQLEEDAKVAKAEEAAQAVEDVV